MDAPPSGLAQASTSTGGIIVEHNSVEHSIRNVYAQHALIERMGKAYGGDSDQAKEDFLVETKLGLSDVAEEDDCVVLFREDQSFSAALQAELDIPEGEVFDPRKLRWEFVSHDHQGMPNQFIYARDGLAGEGFISNVAYGGVSTRHGDLGDVFTDAYDSRFYTECDGVFSRCIVLVRDEFGDWVIDDDLTAEINHAMSV